MGWRGQLKRIKYEIRLSEPNKPMSTGPKKVEPILYVGTLTERRPRLAHQVSDSWKLAPQGEDLLCKDETCSTRMRLAPQGGNLLCKDETCSTRMKLAQQGWNLLYKEKTCSARMRLAPQEWDLLYKEETCSARMRLAPQGWDLLYKGARPHYYKKPQHPHKKVRVTNSSLAL